MGASPLPLLLLPLLLPRAGRPLAPTAMAPPLPRTIPSSIGLNTFFFNEGPYASEEELSVLAASGATYVRNEMVWREIEHAEGRYDWTLMDDLTAALARHRLKGMFLFGPEPPALYNLSGTCPHTPSQRAAFARWAGAAMRRYGGQGHLWEILNEPLSFWRCETGAPPDRWCACTGAAAPPGCPSCGGGWNTSFCRELFRDITDLHLAITAVAPPGEYLIGGGVSQAVFDCDKDQTFLQYLLSAPPLLERWDAVSVHAYRDPACTGGSFDPETAIDSFAATFERIRRMTPATRQRPPVALIQSEWGYASNAYDPTHGKVGPLESTPAMQASYLARSYLVTALANVSVHFWYAWLDCVITPPIAPPPPPGALPPAAVGIATGKCNYSSVGYDPRPTVWDVAVKPSYLALRTIATGLRGLRCVGRLPTVNGTADDFIVGFAAPAAAAPPHMAAWTRRNTTQTVALEGQAASSAEACFQVEGTLGQPQQRVCIADGVLVLSLTRNPIYLHRAPPQAQTVAIRPPPTAAVAGLKMDDGVTASLPVLPPPPPPGQCTWHSASGTGPVDTKTACRGGPGTSMASTLVGTHADAPNVTHIDTQTIEYKVVPALVDPKRSKVKVAAITTGASQGCDLFSLDKNHSCALEIGLLELAGTKGADVAVLPEEFFHRRGAPPLPDCDMSPGMNCSAVNTLGAIAKKHSMYIVFGMRAAAPPGDPYPADPERGNRKLGYNTDVILDRQGEMVGYYRKAWPCCPGPDGASMDDGYPSRELVKTFDLDFGRVGLQTCFDLNFDDTWHQLYAANADLVFWPSAFGGGMPLRAYAQLYHFNIVPVGWGDITDITGQVTQGLHAVVPQKLFMATLDLDRTYTHSDFVSAKVQRLLQDHEGLVELLSIPEYCSVPGKCAQTADLIRQSGFYLLSRTDKGYDQGVSVRRLLQEYEIESLRAYQHRSRAAINMQRQAASPRPRFLRSNHTTARNIARHCNYSDTDARDSSRAGTIGNITCEPLVEGTSAAISINVTSDSVLSDVLYVDTRTTIFTTPPKLADPRKSRIKVASIAGLQCCVDAAHVNSSLAAALVKLEEAAKCGAGVALLPEEFMCGQAECALRLDGPEVAQLAAVAKKHSMYIVFGMRAVAPPGDPYPADPERGNRKLGYNTDVILDRQGEMVGYYRKAWPCCPSPDGASMDDGYPSRELVKTFDLDFGRVGLQTCFDLNFMDTWHQLYAMHTDIVFWPSAYGGGMPLRAYAKLYHYAIVPAGWGDITDMTGQVAEGLSQEASGVFTATLDLDSTMIPTTTTRHNPQHPDAPDIWMRQPFDALLSDYKGLIQTQGVPGYCSTPGNCSKVGDLIQQSNFLLLRRTDAGFKRGISVRALTNAYNLSDMSYFHQSRRAINMQRMTAAPNTLHWTWSDGRDQHANRNLRLQSLGSDIAQVSSPTAAASARAELSVLLPQEEFVPAWGTVRVKADDDEIQLDTHQIEPHDLVDNVDFSDPQQLKELFGAVASKLAKLEKENVALHIRTRVLEAENKEVRSELAQVRKGRDKHENATQVIATEKTKGRSETTRIRGAGEVSVSSTTINVQDYGAVGDGITDDTVAIQNALNAAGAKTVTFPGGSYLTSSTLTIPSSTDLMCHSATLTGNTGATPYFEIRQGAISVSINGGSFYNINASAFVKATGTFSTNGRYSRQLRFDGVWLETAATTVAFDFSNGVRQAYWSNCYIQANSGFSLVDNIVECSITNSLIFHSGASKVGTAGFYISTTRPNGENEGICVTNCHVDFFEKGFVISDCFIFTISQGYYGGEEMAFDYIQPNVPGNGLSYHTFSGASINQGSHLGPFSGGRAIRFNFNGCSFSTNTRVSLMFDENVYKASVTGCTFSSAAGNATHAVVVNNNAGGIVVQGCSIDETYPNGIAILGNSGLYPNVIRDNDYRGPGNLLPIVQRPTVLANNMIAGSLDGAEAMPSYQVAGTNVGNNTAVFSAGRKIAKGVRGVFQGTIHYTCTSAGAIRLATPPSQTRWPNGTGWDAQEFTVPAAVSTVQTATFSVPFYTTADLLDSVPFQIRWEGSGTMTVAPNSWALLKSDDGEVVLTDRLQVRAIYYNLGFGLNYGNAGLNASVKICASNFDAGDWEVTLDRLVLAQYTDVYFNLWGDTELVFAGSNASYQGIGRAEQSLRLRRSLQQMIPAAHKRGLRVTLMITPTLIPNDIFHSIASKARADIVYAQPAGGGFSVVCPAVRAELQWKNRTWGSTMQLIRELYREQFRAFSEVDFVATWFYDPGGCMCGLHRHNCRGMQAERMLGLVSAMKEEAAAAIPNLRRVDVDTWATWVFEGGKGTPPLAPRPYRDEFFDELKAAAATWPGLETPMVLDTIDDMASTWGSGSTLPNATARGFDTSGFLFGTNPESGYTFWMPSLRYLADSHARGVAWGVTGLHTYRFEEATKSPQTFIAGLIFAGRTVPEAVEGMCSYAVAADDRANRVEACVHGVMLLENFTIRGRTRQNMTQQGAAVRAAFDAAVPASEAPRAPAYLDMADVLRTTGRAMALLGAGVDAAAANDTALDSRLKGEFVELARSSAVFEAFGWDAAGAVAKWPAYKTFLAGGWACADAGLGQTCF